MNEIYLLILVLSTGTLAGNAQDPDHDVVVRSLESLENIISKYTEEIDSKVRLTDLKEAIEAIDNSMFGYQGRAKNRLDSVRSLTSSAGLTFKACVDPVFEWCVAVNSTFNLFLSNIENTDLPPSDKESLWTMTATSIRDGIKKAINSLNSLHQLERKTNQLKIELDRMMADLRSDFGPSGVYTRRVEERQMDILDIKTGRRSRRPMDEGVGQVISRLYQAIIAFLRSLSVGDFEEAFSRHDYCALIDNRRIASKEEEIEMIHKFFEVLIQKITHASSLAGKVDTGLAADKPNLEAVSSPNKDMVALLNNPKVREGLPQIFTKLGNLCFEYTVLRATPRAPPKRMPLPQETDRDFHRKELPQKPGNPRTPSRYTKKSHMPAPLPGKSILVWRPTNQISKQSHHPIRTWWLC